MAEALASTLIDPALQERLAPVLEVRAPQIDAGELPAQSTLTLLAAEGLLPRVEWDSPAVPAPLDLQRAGELLATVAWSDLASAFSLWCHVMTMLYLAYADRGSLLRVEFLPQLERAERWGSTALATALGHAQTGRPLPVRARWQSEHELVLHGFVPWASNLTERFLVVTPAQEDHGTVIVAVPSETAGVVVDPYPPLLALQGTASTSLRFVDVRVPQEWVLAHDVVAFLQRIQPAFLGLQASFCWGLAARALAEARASLRGVNEVFRSELERSENERDWLAQQLRELLSEALRPADRERRCRALELRLAAMRLACSAVALEAKTKGGQAYRADSPAARRQREAAFLPIQTPTEGQLRWELQQLRSST